jgi:hypothetical protein
MDQPADAKPHRPPTSGSWRRGTSGNPGGRPRSALAWSDVARRRLDPDLAFDLLDRYLSDETVPLKDRLGMLLQFAATGFVRPPVATATQLTITGAGAPDDRFAELSTDELRARLAAARAALPAPSESVTPSDE